MKAAKIISLLLTGVLAVSALGACGQGQTKEKEEQGETKEAKGSYVEEEMELPWDKNSEAYLGAFLNEEGKPQIYTQAASEEGTVQIFSYSNTGGDQWERNEETWAKELLPAGTSCTQFTKGEDGNLYLLTEENNTPEYLAALDSMGPEDGLPVKPMKLYRHTPEGENQEVPVERLSLEEQEKEELSMVYYLGAAENGRIVLEIGMGSQLLVYDPETGKELYRLDSHDLMTSEQDGMIYISGNTLITADTDRKNLVLYDLESGKETGSIALGETGQEPGRIIGGDGTYYLGNSTGITVYKEEGSIAEQIFDGTRGLLGEVNTSLSMQCFLVGAEEDFYAVYWDFEKGDVSLCHYYYNAAVSSTAEKELSVYGLFESNMISSAVREFQRKHPEVSVNYEYALGTEDEGNPEDYLDTLNTELLNGEGADVLVLDDMPVDSYIEKGILEDLTEYADGLISDGIVSENILKGSETEGKTYEIPTAAILPLFYGTEEAVSRLENLESIEAYLKENPDGKVVGAASKEALAYLLFCANYADIKEKDGNFSQEKLAKILELAKTLYDNNPSEDMETAWTGAYRKQLNTNLMTGFETVGFDELYNDKSLAGVTAAVGTYSLGMMCDIIKQQGDMAAHLVKESYIPHNRLGVNASSEEKELAKEFVDAVLSDEIQQSDYNEGMPVRLESLDKLGELSENNQSVASASYGGGEIHTWGNPSAKEMETYVEMVKTAKNPLVIDITERTTFLDCAEQYFGGSVSAEEAAKTMAEKMELYLSE